ncbi:MAG TPA: hypothetical protein G4N98_04645 [Thermoflexia bacterium]|nr:hypothetical protein [Thermoflexia bacterium]
MKKWYVVLMVILLIGGLMTQRVHAHSADMYFQSLVVQLAPDGVRVEWAIAPGPLLAGTVWNEADQDQKPCHQRSRSLGLG